MYQWRWYRNDTQILVTSVHLCIFSNKYGLDALIDGYKDRWIDGCKMDEWIDGCKDGWMQRWMNKWMGVKMDGYKDG